MSKKITTDDDKSKGQIVDVACAECKRKTKHEVLHSIDMTGQEDWGENDWYGWEMCYQIIRCKGCESISFRTASSNSEDHEQIGHDEWDTPIHEDLFPSRSKGRIYKYDFKYLPVNVYGIYHETIQALNGEQAILTGIGIRAIIEAICKDKNTHSTNLQNKIDELVTMGVLTRDGADILHKLRVIGNLAAHEVKPHTNEQLSTALDVVEHLFEGVYVLPKKAKETFQ